uniref:Small ribosomal subunit protein uS3m n=1 Tax=Chaetosphaeridium globosum TaxID=96477 RepID=Q8M1G0_CHAGL|nr:ribosomal protein S3 [Chaetosphaeridium globosum]AAM96625.1 ribosomal protein S3 [Chaetosphaeridium globosum]
MAQKVNPISLRLDVNRSSDSLWFSDYYYTKLLYEDLNLREYFNSIHKMVTRCIIHRSFGLYTCIHLFCLPRKRRKHKVSRLLNSVTKEQATVSMRAATSTPQSKSDDSLRINVKMGSLLQGTNGRELEPVLHFFVLYLIFCKRNQIEFNSIHFTRLVRPIARELLSNTAHVDFGSSVFKKTRFLNLCLTNPIQLSHRKLSFGSEGGNTLNQVSFGATTTIRVIRLASMYQSAASIAADIVQKIESKKSFRSICKFLFSNSFGASIKGIRIACSGRFNGAEIAKTECRKYGASPFHVFSEKIDYAQTKASTPYGIMGIKVWVCYK